MSARITVMIQAQRTVSLFHELTVYDDIRERDKSLYICVCLALNLNQYGILRIKRSNRGAFVG